MNTDIIEFKDPKKDYGFMSNFYNSPFIIDGITYANVEVFYQINKFDPIHHKEYRNLILSFGNTPGKVKILANQNVGGWDRFEWARSLAPIIDKYKKLGVKLRDDWDNVKLMYMIIGVENKFRQNIHLKNKLLETKNKYIKENNKRDPYWGVGSDGKGKNMLGKILMCLRDIYLRDKLTSSPSS
jgi:predicted NAD-dependent protein-ADP-ribosyltransferase YbiA (DUF1768 family)